MAVTILPHDVKALLKLLYIAFHQLCLVKGKIDPVVLCLVRQNKHCLKTAWLFVGGSGLDGILIFSDQNGTRTEKFPRPLISGTQRSNPKQKLFYCVFKGR